MAKSKSKKTPKKTSNKNNCNYCGEAVDASGLIGMLYVDAKQYSYKLCRTCVNNIPGFKAGKATEERKKFWKDFAKQLVKLNK